MSSRLPRIVPNSDANKRIAGLERKILDTPVTSLSVAQTVVPVCIFEPSCVSVLALSDEARETLYKRLVRALRVILQLLERETSMSMDAMVGARYQPDDQEAQVAGDA